MNLFDVYPVFPIEIASGQGAWVTDTTGKKYLDFYGGHAVISVGHTHPDYVAALNSQLSKLGFYSNSIEIPIQKELAKRLGEVSGYEDYSLFLCNSGAEANENALKLASFHTKRNGVLTFRNSFHGRTSLAVAVTDNSAIQAPVNYHSDIHFCDWEDLEMAIDMIERDKVGSVIIEGIQGVGGIHEPSAQFLKSLSAICRKKGTVLILDEIQSGYGRTGKFFAHQYAGITPDIITVAKGMGNGFPIGGVLISPQFKASHGLLGTTFGGNHLACAAGLAVLDIMEKESLMANAAKMGEYLMNGLHAIHGVRQVRGRGLMIAADLQTPVKETRNRLLNEFGIFTGNAKNPATLRLLPPLCIDKEQCDYFLTSLKTCLNG